MADGVVIKINGDDSGFRKTLSGLGGAVRKTASGLTTALRGVTMATGALSAAWSAVGVVGVRYNASIEQMRTSFEVMTGSAEKGAEVLQRIRKLGAETPFETEGLAETVQLLMNYNLTADESIDVMKMLGDVAQGNQDKLTRIATAYGQMRSAGKVMLEDIKQMVEAGFNPLAEISETTGESMASLYERISKGKLTVDEITRSMERSTSAGGKYFQSMEKQSQTLNGRLSTLKDNAMSLLGNMMEPASDALRDQLLPEAIGAVDELNAAFEAEGFDGLTKALQKQISKAGQALKQGLKGLLKQAGDAAPDLVKQIIGGLPQALDGGFELGGDLVELLFGLASETVQGLASRLPELAPVLLKGVGRLGFELLAGSTNLLGSLFSGVMDAFTTTTDEAWGSVMDSMVDKELSAQITADIDATVDASGATSAIETAYDTIYQVLTDGAPDTKGAMDTLKKDIGSTVNELMEAINEWEQEEIAKLDVNSADYTAQVRSIQSAAEEYRDAVKSVESETVSFIDSMAGKSAATVDKEKGRLDELEARLQKVAEAIGAADGQVTELAKRGFEMTRAGATTDTGDITQGFAYAWQNYKMDLQKIEDEAAQAKLEADEAWEKGLTTDTEHLTAVDTIQQDLTQRKDKLLSAYQGTVSELLSGVREAFDHSEPETVAMMNSILKKLEGKEILQNMLPELESNLLPERRAELAPVLQDWIKEYLGAPEDFNLSPNDLLGGDFRGLLSRLEGQIQEELNAFQSGMETSPYLTLLNGLFNSDALADFQIDTSSAESVIRAAGGSLGDAYVGEFVQNINTSGAQVAPAVGAMCEGATSAGKSAMGENKTRSIGVSAVNGIIAGVNSRRAALISTMRSIALAAAQAARSALKINSPSKVFTQIGEYTGLGFEDGLKRSMIKARSTMGVLMNPAYLTGRTAGGGRIMGMARAPEPALDYDRLAEIMAGHQTVLVSNGRVLARNTAADNSEALGAYKRRVAKGYGG